MTIKTVYRVTVFVVDKYGNDWDDYEFSIVNTTNKHFANMIMRMYNNLISNEKFIPYLSDFHNDSYYIREFYIKTIKCFM